MKPIQPQHVINALIQQRNNALDGYAELAAAYAILSEDYARQSKELDEAKAKVAELEAKLVMGDATEDHAEGYKRYSGYDALNIEKVPENQTTEKKKKAKMK